MKKYEELRLCAQQMRRNQRKERSHLTVEEKEEQRMGTETVGFYDFCEPTGDEDNAPDELVNFLPTKSSGLYAGISSLTPVYAFH